MKQPEAPYAARVAAAEALLDRGWGKPKQSHEAEITHRYVIEIPALMDNATWEAEAIEHEPDCIEHHDGPPRGNCLGAHHGVVDNVIYGDGVTPMPPTLMLA